MGRNVTATMVHHILPYKDYPEYAFAEWNLISLCNKEHDKLHDRANDELTDEGIALAERTIRKHNIKVKLRYSE